VLKAIKLWWMRVRAAQKTNDVAELAAISVPKTWTRLKPIAELVNSVWYQTERNVVVTMTFEQHDGRRWLHATLARSPKPPTNDDVVSVKNVVFGQIRAAFRVMNGQRPGAPEIVDVVHLFGFLRDAPGPLGELP
jgi:hypothetical protein